MRTIRGVALTTVLKPGLKSLSFLRSMARTLSMLENKSLSGSQEKREEAIIMWLKKYQKIPKEAQLKEYQAVQADPLKPNVSKVHQLHALRLLLQPKSSILIAVDNGEYIQETIMRAKQNHQYVILISSKSHHSQAFQKADQVIYVKNVKDPEELKQAIEKAQWSIPKIYQAKGGNIPVPGRSLKDIPWGARLLFGVEYNQGSLPIHPLIEETCSELSIKHISPLVKASDVKSSNKLI